MHIHIIKVILGSILFVLFSTFGVSLAHAYITPGEFLGEPSTTQPVTPPQAPPPAIPSLPPRPPLDLPPIPKLEPAKAGTAVPDARDQIFKTRHNVRPTLTRTKDLMPVPARLQYASPTVKEEEIMNDASDPVAERAALREQRVAPSPQFHNAAGPLPASGMGAGLILLSSVILTEILRSLQKR